MVRSSDESTRKPPILIYSRWRLSQKFEDYPESSLIFGGARGVNRPGLVTQLAVPWDRGSDVTPGCVSADGCAGSARTVWVGSGS